MSKVLIIDDSDPAISYTGNWASITIVGLLTGEYNISTHQSSAAGDKLSYTFEGTGVTVYGTLEAPGPNGPPVATFGIDGQTPTAFNSTGGVFVDYPNVVTSYVPLYQSPLLAEGVHTLTITSGTPPTPSARLNIDFLTVETGSDVASGNIIVDDRDEAIQYTGNWASVGTRWEYMLTSKGSPAIPGGTATFRFNGTAITIYGTTQFGLGPNATAAVGFALDGGFTSTYNAPQDTGLTQHYPMYQVKGLSSTQEHTVVITSLNKNTWFLDCIVYTTEDSSVAGGGGGGSGGASLGGTSVGGVDIGGGGGGTNVGAIAGGVIGGIFLGFAIAAIIFLLLRWRQQKGGEKGKREKQKVGTGSDGDALFTPFTPSIAGAYAPANPSPNKPHDSNGNGSTPGTASAERIGWALPDSTASTSYLGTQSPTSSVSPDTNQYYDGESQHIINPTLGPRHGNAHQNLHSQLYSRFDPGPGGGVGAMYQRDSRQDYDQASGRFNAPKALYTHGLSITPSTPAVARPPPSTVRTVEEDSGIRIPARSPPVYTPD